MFLSLHLLLILVVFGVGCWFSAIVILLLKKWHAPPVKMDSKEKLRFVGTSLEEAFQKVSTKFNECIDGISAQFAYIAESLAEENKREQVSFDQKSSIIVELQELDLKNKDIFKAAYIIGGDESKLQIFFQLTSAEMRRKYVSSLM